jgi:hypothetical protein
LIDSLLRAWTNHGASRELYLDNAKIYHAGALKTACLALNIKLLHRAPRDPPGGGLVERFIETAQSQFESEVRAGDLLTLDKLNQAFSATFSWAQSEAHQRNDPRLQRRHSTSDQQPGNRLSVGRLCRKRCSCHGSHSAEDFDGIPVAVTCPRRRFMAKFFTRHQLYKMRNNIPLVDVLRLLQWPHKTRDGRTCFVCPQCSEFLTAINQHTNLGRCFRCETNFNHIDLVMLIKGYDFVAAVKFLQQRFPESI